MGHPIVTGHPGVTTGRLGVGGHQGVTAGAIGMNPAQNGQAHKIGPQVIIKLYSTLKQMNSIHFHVVEIVI